VPKEPRANDIVLFAKILLGEYRQGTPLHDIPQAVEDADAEDGDTFVVEVDAAGDSLSGLLVAFDAVQIAVDAAWVAVQYDNRIASREQWDEEFLRQLANGPNLSLEIVELSAGSFKGIFKARFPGPVSRAVVIAVAMLSGAAVPSIFPAEVEVIPTVNLGTAIIQTAVLVAGAVHDQGASRRQKAKRDAELQRQIAELDAELQRQIAGLDVELLLQRLIAERDVELRRLIAQRDAELQRLIHEPDAELQRQIAEREAELQRQIAQREAELQRQLQRQINELRTVLRDHVDRGKLPTVDAYAVHYEAKVRSIGIEITGRIQISFSRGAA
jgi:hypothetical protein